MLYIRIRIEEERENTNNTLEAMDAVSVEKVASASAFFEPKDGSTIVDVGMASGISSAILAQLFPHIRMSWFGLKHPNYLQIWIG